MLSGEAFIDVQHLRTPVQLVGFTGFSGSLKISPWQKIVRHLESLMGRLKIDNEPRGLNFQKILL